MSGNHNMYCSGNQPDIVQRLRDMEHYVCSGAADEIESLRKQLAECERERDVWKESYGVLESQYLEQLAFVTKERDELVADAKRYRWVRAYCELIEYGEPAVQEDQDSLDAAVDAALAKLGADKKGEA